VTAAGADVATQITSKCSDGLIFSSLQFLEGRSDHQYMWRSNLVQQRLEIFRRRPLYTQPLADEPKRAQEGAARISARKSKSATTFPFRNASILSAPMSRHSLVNLFFQHSLPFYSCYHSLSYCIPYTFIILCFSCSILAPLPPLGFPVYTRSTAQTRYRRSRSSPVLAGPNHPYRISQ